MNLSASLRIALRSLRVNKLRSALTMLGIIIGVGAVIAMVAIGAGATARIQSEIASIGSNVIIVLSGSMNRGGVHLGTGAASTLTENDAEAIAAECPSVQAAAPAVRGAGLVVYGNSNWSTSIQGTTPAYLDIREIAIAQGRAFTSHDVDSAAKVAWLGKTVADKLFGGADPVGQVVRIRQVPITVAGVLAAKGQTPTGQDQDDVVLLPISSAKRKVLGVNLANANAVQSIMVQARGPEIMKQAEEETAALLRQRHRLAAGADDDFNIRNMEEVFSAQETSARVMSILLAAIASVSLIVGGIGIMNIMLVSVTERTREIGLRQSMGAKTGDILTQFLVEATTLSVLGGVIGIVLGFAASALVSYLAGWSTRLGPWPVLMAFAFSVIVGVSFGYYPARKAAYLDPIDALRFE
ncbi:MAG: ABC transporter permease [Bryobacterales bacterium]|nr:ABC transporter permease [Bryobacterales bacterium]